MKSLALISICIFLTSCSLYKRTFDPEYRKELVRKENLRNNGLQIGQSKDDVLIIMGGPTSRSAKGNQEYLVYDRTVHVPWVGAHSEKRYVRLIDGKVESFGTLGDFDSTRDPAQTIHLNINK